MLAFLAVAASLIAFIASCLAFDCAEIDTLLIDFRGN